MNHDQMSPSEMLCAFLDGELDTTETGSLFYSLAQSPELQAEMRQHILLRGAVQNAPHFAPERARENILMRTGLATVAAAGAAGSTSLLRRLFENRSFGLIAASVASSLLTAMTLFNIGSVPAQAPLTAQNNTPVEAPAVAAQLPAAIQEAPVRIVEKRILVPHYIQVPASQAEETVTEDPGTANESLPISNSQFLPQSVDIALNAKVSHTNNSVPEALRSVPVEKAPAAHQFTLQARGFQSYSFPSVTIADPSSQLVNNQSINLSYKISPNTSFGVEIGRENFMQEYKGIEDDVHVKYRQNYPAGWAGASLQYAFDGINSLGGVRPFTRMVVGGTQVGPVARALIGGFLNYDEKFYFMMGMEGTLLAYSYQGQWFSTRKLGFSYGVGFNF